MKPTKQTRTPRWSRRDFLTATSLATGAVVFGVPTLLRGQNLNSFKNIPARNFTRITGSCWTKWARALTP